ncbi:MAG TPA: DUF5615 family PIN-like protein [Planctomycetota bacterium]|jgi:predicted nuclease of predicted toxin-antitoxin system
MAERIRFHLDENVDPDVAKALRRYGIDVTTSQEQELLGTDDPVQLHFATAEHRVLVTHDCDLLVLAGTGTHFGIAFCAIDARSIGQIISGLILIYEALLPTEVEGRVEYL